MGPASVYEKDSTMDISARSLKKLTDGYFFDSLVHGCFQKIKQVFVES